jgi:putative membrane protein
MLASPQGLWGVSAGLTSSDPCDLNLDLFCTELLCECEALLERLPEGDEDDHHVFERGTAQNQYDADGDDGEGDD